MSDFVVSAAEACSSFPQVASRVSETGRPVTVVNDETPWVVVMPAPSERLRRDPDSDWIGSDVVRMDAASRTTVLPASWDDPEDDGLYDDLV